MLSLEEALSSLEGGLPSQQPPLVENLARILQRCRKERNPAYAQRLHAYIRKSGLEAHRSLANSLVSMLVEVGSMCDAQQAFDKLHHRNEGMWNSLISGYVKLGEWRRALTLYQKMQEDSVHPTGHTFVPLLNACAKLKDVERGQEIHADIARKGLETDLHVGSTLVDMYAKCDLPAKAQEVFDKLTVRDVVSWNSLIAGYAKQGLGREALNCFEQMRLEGISPSTVTFVCSLKACGSIGATDKGRDIHVEIARKGLEGDLFVGSALVDMYANFGLLAKAREAFEKLAVRDVVSWTSLIGGYAKQGHGEEALNCFKQMQLEGISPNTYTFVCTLKACGGIGAIDKGQEIHAAIAIRGLERDLFVGSTLVDMYANNGFFAKAEEVFDKLPVRDVVSWNALITGYAKHGHGKEALNCFEQMKLQGYSPNTVTFVSSLKACSSIGATDKGQEIHAEIDREGLARDLIVGSTLVDMYANCGFLANAQKVFDNLLVQNVVSWNALITGYIKHGAGQEALNCFEQMQCEGVSPDPVTFVCSLKACGRLGATDKGREIHAAVARKGLDRELIIGSTLVDMYANCGVLTKAQEVFDNLPVRDAASWNALIAGYAQLGESENVFRIFDRMRGEGQTPNLVTFVSVLNACSHAGLVNKGQTYFETISEDYGIIPTLEHHNCMVDLLGRAGQLDKAVAMIKKMPFQPNLLVWHTVLGACRKWGNVEVGRQAFEQAVQLDEKDSSTYFYMLNIFSDADMQEDAEKVQVLRLKKASMGFAGT